MEGRQPPLPHDAAQDVSATSEQGWREAEHMVS